MQFKRCYDGANEYSAFGVDLTGGRQEKIKMRAELKNRKADLVIVGGGVPGICAAIEAARMGVHVILVGNRGVVGGNSSCEIAVPISGAPEGNAFSVNAREGGIVDELRQEFLYRSPHRNRYALDGVYMDKIHAEKNIELFLNTHIDEVETDENGKIVCVYGSQNTTETRWKFEARWFVDDTGDGTLGALSGAEYRIGREAASTFNERIAPEEADDYCIPSTLTFSAKDMGHPVKYVAPDYADDVRPALEFRTIPHQGFEKSQWFYEVSGALDQVKDREELMWQHRALVAGIWDYIKNSGEYPEAENYDFDYISNVPGMREYRRLMGDFIMTENDLAQQREYEDAVAHGGWNFDLHAIKGFYDNDLKNRHIHTRGIYQIPYRSGYSKNVQNLFMCGRCMSMSHVAFGSVRVCATLSAFGQAIGAAAYLCKKYDTDPAGVYENHRSELQQILLRDDQLIPGVRNTDPNDLARKAHIQVSSEMKLSHEPNEQSSYVSLKTGYSLTIPVKNEMDTVKLYVRAKEDTILECRVCRPSKGYNYGPDIFVKTVSVPVSKNADTVVLPVDLKEGGSFYCLEFAENEDLDLLTAPGRKPATILFRRDVNEKPTMWDYDTMSMQKYTYERMPFSLCYAVGPEQDVYSGENINNGYNRAFGQPNVWACDPKDAQPTVALSWDEPVKLSKVQLTFMVDQTSSINSYPLPVFPGLAVDYHICAVCEGREVELVHETGNHLKFRRHTFEPIACSELRIYLDKGVDSNPVGLYEVRAEN